ncbi:MAG: 2-iminoacetate synthase ThiH [Candidatus Margulisbacteria bacterium]|nr:2-iminoacetate synthase ThiH [Candidatus Margulisiibacteriota bacterium]
MSDSFYVVYEQYSKYDLAAFFQKVADRDVFGACSKENLTAEDLLTLLSPQAQLQLEPMAKRASALTIQYFGRVIFLYAPLYLSNLCDNECVYCGFKKSNNIERKQLSLAEVEEEAKAIAATGIKHILILTGESKIHTPLSYLKDSVSLLKNYFSSISLEIYPLEKNEYRELVDLGVDGLTIYQETYDEKLYQELHRGGAKSNFLYRLDTPERACRAKMRSVGVGALLGLAPFRREVFLTGLHARYLQDKYPDVEISVSLPRIQPQVSNFSPAHRLSDTDLVQALLALRLFLPRVGINLSTRENSHLRDNLIGLGVTRMSAGSKTFVGGYASKEVGECQFAVSDQRSAAEIKIAIRQKGCQPVMKDWQLI